MSTYNTYDIGDLVRGSAVYTNAAGSAIDPGTVTFAFRNGSGAATTYTYPTDAALVKDSTGHYHADFSVSASGFWFYRFAATGTGQSAGENMIYVRVSNF